MSLKVVEVTDLDVAFGNIEGVMPAWDRIPERFRNWNLRDPYVVLFGHWFYEGIENLRVWPRPGVDPEKAMRMIRCVMGSFQPPHEEKTAAVAYMLHEFFERVEYKPKKATGPILLERSADG